MLGDLERGFEFYEPNVTEVRNLASKLLDPLRSHHAIVQCAAVCRFIDGGADRIRPPMGPRPDMIWTPYQRDIDVEVTSHNHDNKDITALARSALQGCGIGVGWRDPNARNYLAELHEKTIAPKLAKCSPGTPTILIMWDTEILDATLLVALKLKDLRGLLKEQAVDLTPLSAVVMFRDETPHILSLPPDLSSGPPLAGEELAILNQVFETDPTVGYRPRR